MQTRRSLHRGEVRLGHTTVNVDVNNGRLIYGDVVVPNVTGTAVVCEGLQHGQVLRFAQFPLF